jgi:hypothetical protein
VAMDPRIEVSAVDLQAHRDAGLTLRDYTNRSGPMITGMDAAAIWSASR